MGLFIGLYIHQGLSPLQQVKYKFNPHVHQHVKKKGSQKSEAFSCCAWPSENSSMKNVPPQVEARWILFGTYPNYFYGGLTFGLRYIWWWKDNQLKRKPSRWFSADAICEEVTITQMFINKKLSPLPVCFSPSSTNLRKEAMLKSVMECPNFVAFIGSTIQSQYTFFKYPVLCCLG